MSNYHFSQFVVIQKKKGKMFMFSKGFNYILQLDAKQLK